MIRQHLLPLLACGLAIGLVQHGVRAESIMASAISPPAETAASSINVAPCAAPPKIDGVLDDACWKSATHAPGFYRYQGTTAVSEQTEAWICADASHLYVAFHCLDHHPELIKAMETTRDGDIVHDDHVTITIDSQNTRRNTSQFSVSARGVQTESMEGGTADNITWAGDWKAAVTHVADGWTVEVEIPFALLRYARGTHSMGILLTRILAREIGQEEWPYMSRDDQLHPEKAMTAFVGLAPVDYRPHPIYLPYVLGTAGEGYAGRVGMDVKYPLTTTMTGVLTVNPDFRDVEQQVQNIAFSYTPQFYQDHRPFFAEGRNFLPYRDVFYPLAIDRVDEGIKVAGKQGGTTVNLIGVGSHENGGRSDLVANMTQEFGALSNVHLAMAQDSQFGIPGTRVFKAEGVLGWQQGRKQNFLTVNHMPSWVDNRPSDARDYTAFEQDSPGGQLSYYISRNDTGPNFKNNIGAIPEIDSLGEDWWIQQQNAFDTGHIDGYFVQVGGDDYHHHTGGFFHRTVFEYANVSFRSGWNASLQHVEGARDQYHDHLNEVTVNWSTQTLYARGGIDATHGTLQDQKYTLVTVYQGLGLTKKIALNLSANERTLGADKTTQTVLTGAYRITYERSIGIRVVSQDKDVNLFFSFEQKARAGNDIYFLIGDPNSVQTRGLVTLKVVHPF